ncbi:polysaccharide deacetylase family protein [Streptomyces sp. NPDC102394]|uniref:polysaccharide deacetylase family protein n=1 Tax=Streptomyces sp. NPDC102394 TaxID=3366167 RepID=UPI003803DC10
MTSDSHTGSRRRFLTGALTAAAAVAGSGLLLLRHSDNDTPGTGASATTPRPGPPGRPAPHSEAFRLRPIAGDSSMGEPPHHPQVRTQAEEILPGARHAIALTFDDGPHPDNTPRVLSALRKHKVQATFFVIGENAAAFPQLVHAIAADGHVIGNHSYTHPQLTRLSADRVKDELGRTSDVIDRILGSPPQWCRAPYGDWDTASLKICAELEMEPLGWSIDTLDWARPGVTSIEDAVTRNIRPGSIILQHDGGGDRSQTVRAVTDYLPRLLDDGYRFVRPRT